MLTATVVLKTARYCHVYDTIGMSVDGIAKSAEELAGDEPFGLTVVVHK